MTRAEMVAAIETFEARVTELEGQLGYLNEESMREIAARFAALCSELPIHVRLDIEALAAYLQRELALTLCRKTANDCVIARLTERVEILALYGPRRPRCYATRLQVRRCVIRVSRQRRPRRARQRSRDDPEPAPNSKTERRPGEGRRSILATLVIGGWRPALHDVALFRRPRKSAPGACPIE